MSDTNTPAASGDQPYDQADEFAESEQIATNDAVAGETVFPGVGEGNDGPTGGAPREGSPEYAPNDLEGDDIDLDETE
ncbi:MULTISPECIES: hypothetical protein [unclassified Frigoribacterium]|jgi:hypothetical protein|uniref:hypothetical protein n=1 Tax=unclassified Frigoribacterium TaxID=2627005 RepID=UPI0005B9F093|nr:MULTISPECIES: hypothetical protein [unclassified Frigoribacterium]KIU03539.1 hypothetical protein SZ60_05170 [Frigoribacterium sp. MEB024]KQN41491.1 hypothetical protein ASE87_11595 [Frigoribacterium sp. Leaf44]